MRVEHNSLGCRAKAVAPVSSSRAGWLQAWTICRCVYVEFQLHTDSKRERGGQKSRSQASVTRRQCQSG